LSWFRCFFHPDHLERDWLGKFDGHDECIVVREMIPDPGRTFAAGTATECDLENCVAVLWQLPLAGERRAVAVGSRLEDFAGIGVNRHEVQLASEPAAGHPHQLLPLRRTHPEPLEHRRIVVRHSTRPLDPLAPNQAVQQLLVLVSELTLPARLVNAVLPVALVEIVNSDVALEKVSNCVDNNTVTPDNKDRSMSWSGTKAVMKLTKLLG